MNNFRTHTEMSDVYQRISSEGLEGKPYVVDISDEQRLLVFFGAKHTNELEDPQWQDLESQWSKFLEHDNPNKIVLYEMAADGAEDLGPEQAISAFAESGWIVKKAQAAGVPAELGEPDRIEEIAYLKERFSVPQIITYYFGRQMHQWARQDRKNQPDWRTYAEDTIGAYNSLRFWGEELSLDKATQWYQEQTGKAFDPEDMQALDNVRDPEQNEVSEASGLFRDEAIFKMIEGHWNDGADVFVVYGSGHAIVQEPALRALVGQG